MNVVSEKDIRIRKRFKETDIAENYKILQKIFFKFIVALSMRVSADIRNSFTKKIIVNIESLVFVKELSISFTVLKMVHLWLLSKG